MRFILSVAVLILAVGVAPPTVEGAPSAPVPTVARIHWMGMKQLSGDTNAARLMTIWNLPESRRLEQQTLDKLSRAPWQLWHRKLDTNAAARLRPLLDDLVANESCLFIRQGAGQPAQLALVIRLDDSRAALWQSNLAQVLKSLTGITPDPAPPGHYGWALKKHHAPNVIELSRAGGWTILGAANDFNGLLPELTARIQRSLPPVIARNAGDWLEADLDPSQLVPALTALFPQPSDTQLSTLNSQLSPLNSVHLSLTGNGTNVLTTATADFSRPLAINFEPWIIPTNLIADPLTDFTLVRGFKPWLESSAAWTNLPIRPAPDQICIWGMKQFPMETYFTIPLPDADSEVSRLANWMLQKQKAWLTTNHYARFEQSKTFNGLEWKGAPFATPFVRSASSGNQSLLFGGGLAATVPGTLPLDSVQSTISRTNLVYHNWEETGPRITQWLYLTQFVRFVLRKDQLPSDSVSVQWLKAAESKLGASVTDITQTGPNQLSLTRRSDTGFTALELNLLADWLESPQFPRGLYSLLTPPSI